MNNKIFPKIYNIFEQNKQEKITIPFLKMYNEMSISSNDLNSTCKLSLSESNDHKSFI